jgi:hypothetical protein
MCQAALPVTTISPPAACTKFLAGQLVVQQEGEGGDVPWTWQSPECLVEFSEMAGGGSVWEGPGVAEGTRHTSWASTTSRAEALTHFVYKKKKSN